MKTEHAIDWRKTAEEIEADYSTLCMDRDEQAERIRALKAHNAVLREALSNVLPWVVTQVIACNGLKCRERVCMSCTEEAEAEECAQEACNRYREAKQALASTPEQSLSSIRREERERVLPNGTERYRVEKTDHGFWPYCVRAGNGTRELFVGHQKSCTKVARELATAFEDGKFCAAAIRQMED